MLTVNTCSLLLRFLAESNRRRRFCRPLPNHSAKEPYFFNPVARTSPSEGPESFLQIQTPDPRFQIPDSRFPIPASRTDGKDSTFYISLSRVTLTFSISPPMGGFILEILIRVWVIPLTSLKRAQVILSATCSSRWEGISISRLTSA